MKTSGILLLWVLVCSCFTLQAQENYRRVSFIVKAAPVTSKLSPVSDQFIKKPGKEDLSHAHSSWGSGYNIGLATDIRLIKRLYAYVEVRKTTWTSDMSFTNGTFSAVERTKMDCMEIIPLSAKYVASGKKLNWFFGLGAGKNIPLSFTETRKATDGSYVLYDDKLVYDGKRYRKYGDIFIQISTGVYMQANSRVSIFTSAEYNRSVIAPFKSFFLPFSPDLIPLAYNIFAFNGGIKFNLEKAI